MQKYRTSISQTLMNMGLACHRMASFPREIDIRSDVVDKQQTTWGKHASRF